MATFTVTSLADSGVGTLREALGFAEANGTGLDIINFDSALNGGTILLNSQLTISSGSVLIDGDTDGENGGFTEDNITISGDSDNSGGVPGLGDVNHLFIAASATAFFVDVIFAGGYGETVVNDVSVASIRNEGSLFTDNVHFDTNTARPPNAEGSFADGIDGRIGAIIHNTGNLTMTQTLFSGNRVFGSKGGDGASFPTEGGYDGGDGGISSVIYSSGVINVSGLGFDQTGGAGVSGGRGGDGGNAISGLPGGDGGDGGASGAIVSVGGTVGGLIGYRTTLISPGFGGSGGDGGANPGEDPGVNGVIGPGGSQLTVLGGGDTTTTIRDDVFGTYGNDTITAPDVNVTDRQVLFGFSGNDTLNPGSNERGDDFYGGSGRDTITGGGGNDRMFGGRDRDVISGNADNDSLFGGGGDDTLNGGTGIDVVDGGSGDDVIVAIAGDGGAGETYDGGEGYDTLAIQGGAGVFFTNQSALTSIEEVSFFGAGPGANIAWVVGADAFGQQGLSTANIQGDAGTGTDNTIEIQMQNETMLDLSGLTFQDWQGADTGNDVINIFGDGDAETIIGSSANDALIGDGGDDRLDGGAGNDSMFGGTGNDTYIVDNVLDLVFENGADASDQVFSTVTYNVPVNVELLILGGTADIDSTGTGAGEIIIGNSGNNTINGAGGIDVMRGEGGNDTYAVDNSSDAVIEAVGGGDDVVYTSVDYIMDANQEVETAILTGNATVLRGDDSDNQLFGSEGVNVLEGKLGTDYLLGLGGDDIFQVTKEANATDLDVFGDFEGAGVVGGDRVALDAAQWGMDGIVTQVSQTSFIVSRADGSNGQQFIIANLEAGNSGLLIGDDYYFA